MYAEIAYHRWSDNPEIIAHYAKCLAKNNDLRAAQYFQDAIKAYKTSKSTKKNDDRLKLASLCIDFYLYTSALRRNNDEFSMATEEEQQLLLEALEIYRAFERQEQGVNKYDIARTLTLLGLSYMENEEYRKAHLMFEEALAITRNLAEKYPEEYVTKLQAVLKGAIMVYSRELIYFEDVKKEKILKKLQDELEVVTQKLESINEVSVSE